LNLLLVYTYFSGDASDDLGVGFDPSANAVLAWNDVSSRGDCCRLHSAPPPQRRRWSVAERHFL
jgi:hypothetical protein